MSKAVTSATFEEEVLKSEATVIVDFHATWCGPCKMLAPNLAKLEEAHKDLVVAKIDIDAEPGLASQFKIEAVPTLLLFRDGKPVNKAVGYLEYPALENFAKNS